MKVTNTTTKVAPQPARRDLDEIISGLDTAWKATTYSMLAFFIGFLGAGPLYLTFTRDADGP